MVSVSYPYKFSYTYDQTGSLFPRLAFSMRSSGRNSNASVDVDAYLDCGAQQSLFDGQLGALLEIDILKGERLTYTTTYGSGISVTLHSVRLYHQQLGSFELEVGFSSVPISRNLLGRDFFALVQLGFRERYSTFFLDPTP